MTKIKCKFCDMEFEDKDYLFCPHCGKPIYKDEIEEKDRPTNLRYLIIDLKGNPIGYVLNNKRCSEIHILGRNAVLVLQIDYRTLDIDIFFEDDKRLKEIISTLKDEVKKMENKNI